MTTRSEYNEAITARLSTFDLLALLRLIKYLSYEESDIWFSSHNSLASSNRIIQSVTLAEKYVNIELNLGLLSGGGLLPDYIRYYMNQPNVDDTSMVDLFQFFEHLLILHYIAQVYPEINCDLFPSWTDSKHRFVNLQNMRSDCGVFWIFQKVFPEFSVSIERKVLARPCQAEKIKLGEGSLGSNTTFGGQGWISGEGFSVSLVLNPESSCRDIFWQKEARHRLDELILPFMDKLNMQIDIDLMMGASSYCLKLDGHSMLGYEPFPGRKGCEYITSLHTGTINLEEKSFESIIHWGLPCRIHI